MMLQPRSLMAQILRWHAIAVLITAIAVAGSVYLFLDTTAARIQQQTLHVHAQALQQALSHDGTGRLRLTQDNTSAAVFAPGAGFAFRIVDRRGAVLFQSQSRMVLPTANIPLEDEESFFRRQSRRTFYAGTSYPARIGNERVWIAVLQNLTHPDYILDDLLAQFLLYGMAIVAPLLLLLLAIDVLIIRRAVLPVRRASASLETAEGVPLDLRLHDERLPAEVRPLALAVNAMLERLASSYRMQRDFTADAAHELRTPIAVARLRVEGVEDPGLRGQLRGDLDMLGRIVEQLLEIAELETVGLDTAASVDLVRIATESVASIAPLAFRAGKSIAFSSEADKVVIAGHAAWIAKALGCLIENAVTHSGEGRLIEVTVRADGTLAVCDDGSGVPEQDQTAIFRRFWKRDRSAGRSSGLGLAIVAQVAEAHQTTVTLTSRPGRTRFAIVFRLISGG
ncbi:sensor histidine kinase [Sphingomonas faeni]|uniref:sensor histidine kinase n=1 Tax=Sphingomonas faeni TaxID=185950 RepID=UPI00277E8781|nr:HAMP domain-containing sensor histidine kinase [Sphingomonas faeni]MDQ0839964.1 signal transduction histidine kinase [Sphingomonas faeni]